MKFSPQDYVSTPTIPASASYATSASYALTAQTLLGSVTSASYATSASFALTASYVRNSVSSSFATTASFVQNAQTASFVQNAVSSSFATTSSFTLNSITTSSVSLNTITFTKGNGTTFPITVNTGSGGATLPGGSTTQIQYNNAGAFDGTSTLTFDGATITANPITATGYFIPKNAVGSLSTVGGDYTISNPGVYRFTTIDSLGGYYINFPNPATPADGQIIIIINSDALYAGYYGATYQPQDALGTAIPIIGAGQVDTFVNMEGIWIRTARRP
jgi:hypothetical protein